MSTSALATVPDTLNVLLECLTANIPQVSDISTRNRYILSGAALAVVLKVLLGLAKPKMPKYISNLDSLQQEYDVIVVGGGTTGCALATRLSEDPKIRVLLLEAGGSGTALNDSTTPAGFGRLLFHPTHVHGLRTEPQVAAGGKTNFWPRAKMLGGCSSINAQMAQYGAAGDFDEWATLMNDPSWSWNRMAPYFNKFEAFQKHPDYPAVDASVRGDKGPVHVGYFNTITAPSKAFVDACVGAGIKRTEDFCGRDKDGRMDTMGAARIMTYVSKNHKRVSAESAYLTPDVLARPNLTVAIHATATRIIFETPAGAQKPRAVGVEFGKVEGKKTWTVRAKKEIIISGGAVHSPHILQLSGIGPAAELKQHGITPVVELPGVGQRLVDHPVIDLFFKDKLNASAKFLKPTSVGDVMKALGAVAQYKLGNGGPLAMNFGECAAFVRSDDRILFPKDQFPEDLKDSTSAPDAPDLEFFSTPFAYKEHGQIMFDVHTFALHVYLLRPTSHGAVKLKSANPWQQPSVNPNYLSTPEDTAKLMRGVKLLLRIAQTEPLAGLLDASFTRADLDHTTHLRSDAELEALIRERVETVYHPTSTCRMAPRDQDGVVDTSLRVYGVDGLRVCDTSVFPWIISGHTAGACFAIAEKLADEIKKEVELA